MSKSFATRTVRRLTNRYPDYVNLTIHTGSDDIDLDTGLTNETKQTFCVKGLLTPVKHEYTDHSGRPSRDFGGFFDLSECELTILRNQFPCSIQLIKDNKITVSQNDRTWHVDPKRFFVDDDIVALSLSEAS